MFLYSVLFVAVGMLNTYLGVRLPALLVGLLERKAPIQEMAVRLAILIICIVLADFVWQYASAELDFGRMFYDKYYMMLLNRKMMDVDYELLENEKNQPAIHIAFFSFSVGIEGVDGALYGGTAGRAGRVSQKAELYPAHLRRFQVRQGHPDVSDGTVVSGYF